MSLHSVGRTYSLALGGLTLIGAVWLGFVVQQRFQRASSLHRICGDGAGQTIRQIRARAATVQVDVHESAGSILLSAPTPIPPGTSFCHFEVVGESVANPDAFID
jgi:hypothetical protein